MAFWTHRGTISGGDAIRLSRGRLSRPGRNRPVIALGGLNSTADTWPDGQSYVGDPVFGRYLPSRYIYYGKGLAIASVATETLLGNETMRDRIDTAIDDCRASGFFPPTARVSIIGGSAGAISGLQYAIRNPEKIRRMVLGICPVSTQALYDDNWGGIIRGYITTAYGGRPDDEEDPLARAEEYAQFAGRVRLYNSTNDPISNYTLAEEFCERSGIELISMGAVGHDFDDPYSEAAVSGFLQGEG